MGFCGGRDPDVVLGNRPASISQLLFQMSVFAGNIEVA
jgi:hypothetical protein